MKGVIFTMITSKEKEALYEEFKQRMKEEQKTETELQRRRRRNLKPASDYCDEHHVSNLFVWEDIMSITKRVFGAKRIEYIRDEDLSKANEFAIKLHDLCVEYHRERS